MYHESGHYINVVNLNLLNEHIAALGTTYVPTRTGILLAALQDLYTLANVKLADVQTAKNNWTLAVDDRQDAFSDLRGKATRIIGILSGTNVSAQLIKDAVEINRKIQGPAPKKPKAPETPVTPAPGSPPTNGHSTSRQSYDSLYENFSDLVNLLLAAPGYDPTGAEFRTDALKLYRDSLLAASEAVDVAEVEVVNKRIARNQFLYTPETGLVDTALAAREYIKGLFGAASPQYLAVQSIRFKNNP